MIEVAGDRPLAVLPALAERIDAPSRAAPADDLGVPSPSTPSRSVHRLEAVLVTSPAAAR